MLSEDMRMDSINYYPNKTVQYNVSVLNTEKEAIDLELIRKGTEENLVKDVKTNPGFAAFREHNVTVCYKYNDKNANTLFKITISPAMYK